MRIQATLLALLGLLALSHAQLKITLDFGKPGPREVFVASQAPREPPSNTVKADGATLEYNLPAFGDDDRIYVWDKTANNLASKPIKEIKEGKWAVKEFSLLGLFRVRVEHKGEPVQAAKVSVSTKSRTDEKLLDPSGKGEVQFFAFPSGDLRVKVTCNTTDKKQTTQELVFTEGMVRDTSEPVLTVAVSEDVATATQTPTPAAGASSAPAKPKEAVEGGSAIGKLIIMLLALAAIAGAAYWVYHMAKHKPREFEDALQKLGVQIPKPQEPGDGAPTPVAPLPPAPPAPKIMLDDAEPLPLGSVPVASSNAMTASGDPAFVGENGERVTLADGETIVGREDGLGVSLAGESTVSRRHAKILRSGATVSVIDLGSTNGTFVNGNRLQSETTLRPGDQVQFGSVRFRFEG